jgi:hypothetical protein
LEAAKQHAAGTASSMQNIWSARLRCLFGMAMWVLVAACGLLRPDVTGTWIKETQNGRPLPIQITADGFAVGDSMYHYRIEEVRSSITLRADETYVSRLTTRSMLCRPNCDVPGAIRDDTSGWLETRRGRERIEVGTRTDQGFGYYRQRGSRILFTTSHGQRQFPGEVEGNTLRIGSDEVAVYHRAARGEE